MKLFAILRITCVRTDNSANEEIAKVAVNAILPRKHTGRLLISFLIAYFARNSVLRQYTAKTRRILLSLFSILSKLLDLGTTVTVLFLKIYRK